MDADIKEAITILYAEQTRNERAIGELVALVRGYADASDARMRRTEEAIANLARNVDKYVEAADARMKRIEENLDGLIRAITREHSNGKAH